MNEREEYPLFRRLHDYVHSLSKEQLDAVYCAYELGGGLDGYAPPKLIDSDVEEDDEDCAIKRFKNMQEWIDWVVSDFKESKKEEAKWIDYQRDADRLISMNSLSKCLKRAIYYLFE